MAKRQRDYKAEYARRNAKAQRQGYSGYSHKRTVQIKAKVWADRLADRMAEFSIVDMFDDENFPDVDESAFWEVFRNYYAKGTVA